MAQGCHAASDDGASGAPYLASFRCEVCGYVYDEDRGEPREGFPPGTAWADVPDDWTCPDCGVREKIDFIPVEVTA